MPDDPLALLSESKRSKAHEAIKAVLGAATVFNVRPLVGGVSGASVFLIEAQARRFVLRIEGVPGPLRNPHQYHSMRIAAEEGIAPRLHYFDTDDRVALMDFIEDRPLVNYPAGLKDWRVPSATCC